MAVLPMKRVLICALNQDRKPILEQLQRQGVVQIEDSALEDDIFTKQDRSEAQTAFRKNADMAARALAVLDKYAPQKKDLKTLMNGRRKMPVKVYEEHVQKRDQTMQVCRKILSLEKERAENAAALPKLKTQMVALESWLSYDLPLDYDGTKATTVFAGTLPSAVTLENIYRQLAEDAPQAEKVDVQIISTSQVQTCIFVVCSNSDAAAVQDALRRRNFSKPPATSVNPAEAMKELQQKSQQLQSTSVELEKQLKENAVNRKEIEFAVDYYHMRADKYEVIGRLSQSKRTFVLQGYIPAKNAQRLENWLESQFDVIVEYTEPGEKDDIPILLQNNGFAEAVEPVVESYSLPGKGEMDPSMLVACSYYILFGMMLSDAAYGLIMLIGSGIALKKLKDMSEGLRKTLKMFFFCGISTTVFGFLFGSFFGDAVNVIATTFFNRPDIRLPALWFEPLNRPMKMLVFCFAVGILHLFVGLGAKFYMYVKNGEIWDGICDVIFWYMMVGGAIAFLLSLPQFTSMMGLTFTLSAQAGKIVGMIALAGMFGIILTGGRESRNWGKRILKGLYGVYGITGYLSDILSYSRLLALGLATSVIATVFNKMGSMLGNSVGGVIVFIVVFIIGHTMNLAINALGAYVHTNRLEFVEFFGKFYDGGGRPFEPFAVHTKYYKIEEDDSE
ncbi:V-type ATP synthase subunit I [Caproicibacterium lactatifermentans]|jgi:V/A-type H+-transporting ATPase subunit I|uniref:V-type ATP synthase subunit I n=1 Tax=Caproicibacterium lactatifermentans TaxID=2666138 RepID=A0A859DRS3_9FIRM|nr:V-type ATP synthase subunit I [Caproicibacterium lactatifermentans]ARP49739.1 V-type ATP synthase subunit I [Ruminococcaceae bacterium CPB6]MDD4807136.1 V-type ATP synthase subunit I [Oscillospiraceae bacterium]QKN24530.1 V-type ATP synthase subunit I [Caproicibacterium lactatifermentans]QKO30456.1 V-type ATP synthase subunit I [Caproicibacterium lactatifermentans]